MPIVSAGIDLINVGVNSIYSFLTTKARIEGAMQLLGGSKGLFRTMGSWFKRNGKITTLGKNAGRNISVKGSNVSGKNISVKGSNVSGRYRTNFGNSGANYTVNGGNNVGYRVNRTSSGNISVAGSTSSGNISVAGSRRGNSNFSIRNVGSGRYGVSEAVDISGGAAPISIDSPIGNGGAIGSSGGYSMGMPRARRGHGIRARARLARRRFNRATTGRFGRGVRGFGRGVRSFGGGLASMAGHIIMAEAIGQGTSKLLQSTGMDQGTSDAVAYGVSDAGAHLAT
jgi:hypothetical protein